MKLKVTEIGIWTYCYSILLSHKGMYECLIVTSSINNMGDSCNKIACNIWDFCIAEKFWIPAAHIQGDSNKKVDKQSRILGDSTE